MHRCSEMETLDDRNTEAVEIVSLFHSSWHGFDLH